jgi:hypothetical protein
MVVTPAPLRYRIRLRLNTAVVTHQDSVDKIIGAYFTCVATQPFVYKHRTYEPRALVVSPLLFRRSSPSQR